MGAAFVTKISHFRVLLKIYYWLTFHLYICLSIYISRFKSKIFSFAVAKRTDPKLCGLEWCVGGGTALLNLREIETL